MSIKPDNCKIAIWHEASLNDGSGSGSALTVDTILAFDWTDNIDKETQFPKPHKATKKEYVNTRGPGVGKIHKFGFKAGESSVEFKLLTGMFLYYFVGGCSTVGTAMDPAWTDTVNGAPVGNVVTMTSHLGMTPDLYIGKMMEVTGGDNNGKVYVITDNDGTTLTVFPTPTANLASDTIKMTESPFTHTLSVSSTKPTFCLHIEKENGAYPIREDYLGCIVKEIEIICENGDDTPIMCNVSLLASQPVAGSDLVIPNALEKRILYRKDVSILSLTYNSTELEASMLTLCEKHTIKMSEEVVMQNAFSTDYVGRVKRGKINYELSYLYPPQNNTPWTIAGLDVGNYTNDYGTSGFYAGLLAMNTKIGRSATDYINITLSHLHLIPDNELSKFPDWEKGELWIDLKLEDAPLNALTLEIKDDLNAKYYERGG